MGRAKQRGDRELRILQSKLAQSESALAIQQRAKEIERDRDQHRVLLPESAQLSGAANKHVAVLLAMKELYGDRE